MRTYVFDRSHRDTEWDDVQSKPNFIYKKRVTNSQTLNKRRKEIYFENLVFKSNLIHRFFLFGNKNNFKIKNKERRKWHKKLKFYDLSKIFLYKITHL